MVYCSVIITIMMTFTSQKLKALPYCVGFEFIPNRMFCISVSLKVSKSLLVWPEKFFPPPQNCFYFWELKTDLFVTSPGATDV